MDVDRHGPGIPRILGLTGVIQSGENPKTISALKYLPNMDVVSIETLVKYRDAAMICQGPLRGGVIRQLIADIERKRTYNHPIGILYFPDCKTKKAPDRKGAFCILRPVQWNN